ncbi:MAG: pentapeptide repeat-containing protein [Anaerolineales bacterium]|nr:pentapeptide repeat-containing protein [Anaerolineales bacterium]
MKQGWKYLLYASIVIVGGFILIQTIRLKNTGFEGKSLWDWMELLIIPAVLASGAFFLNRSERAVERQIAEDRAKLEREIALDRQHEAALQSYFDRMAELLLREKLRTSNKKEVRDIARTRTLSIMRGLDTRRNNLVIHFLRETNLINSSSSILKTANMEDMRLQGMDFYKVFLHDANLKKANLQGSYLEGSNLEDARLWEANLQDANLTGANMSRASLWKANLQNAILADANLQGAILVEANLRDATVTEEQLSKAKSIQGATMPNGTKHE